MDVGNEGKERGRSGKFRRKFRESNIGEHRRKLSEPNLIKVSGKI